VAAPLPGWMRTLGLNSSLCCRPSKACVFTMEKIAQEVKQILVGHVQQIVGRPSVHWTNSYLRVSSAGRITVFARADVTCTTSIQPCSTQYIGAGGPRLTHH
jgi:hypothetical protein